jgi:predicted RNA-binding Zn-ribbon protein involved in translation (DUF1610 family)
MKFREPSVSYTVRYHGNEYMEEIEEEPVYPCPECMPVNIRDANNDDATSADYVCNECGCKFDACKGYELTRSGRIAESLCNILAAIFGIFAVICLIGGAVFAEYMSYKNSGDLPDRYVYISLAISVGGGMICVLLSSLFAKLYDKI